MRPCHTCVFSRVQPKPAQEMTQPLFGVPIPGNANLVESFRIDDLIVPVAPCPAKFGEVDGARAILVEPLNLAPYATKVVSADLLASPLEGLVAVKAVEPGKIRTTLCHFEGRLVIVLLEPHPGLGLVRTYNAE